MESQLKVTRYRGTVSLIGSIVDGIGEKWCSRFPVSIEDQQRRINRNGNEHFHVTIMTAAECSLVDKLELDSILSQINQQYVGAVTASMDIISIYDIGASIVHDSDSNTVTFASVMCLWGDALRAKLQLPKHDFHVTLGFSLADIHQVDKSFDNAKLWDNTKSSLLIQNCVDECTSSARFFDDVHINKVLCSPMFLNSRAKLQPVLNRFIYDYVLIGGDMKIDASLLRNVAWLCAVIGMHSAIADLTCWLFSNGFGLMAIQAIVWSYSLGNDADVATFVRNLLPVGLKSNVKRALGQPKDKRLLWQIYTIIDRQQREANPTHSYHPDAEFDLNCMQRKHAETLTVSLPEATLRFCPLPRNFSYIRSFLSSRSVERDSNAPGHFHKLAGSAYPSSADQIAALHGAGVGLIITIHERAISEELQEIASSYSIACNHFHCIDRRPPAHEHLRKVCEVIDEFLESSNLCVLVHCQGGVGRTNMVIMAYLMWRSAMRGEQYQQHPLSAAEAEQIVASQRKVILDPTQETALRNWWRVVMNEQSSRLSTQPAVVTELTSVSETVAAGATDEVGYTSTYHCVGFPPLIILVGLPAAGKSTFSKAVVKALPSFFSRVNKDEMRKKGQCDSVFAEGITASHRRPHTVVVDCCNVTKAKRIEWLAAAHNCRAWCVYFNADEHDCKARVQHRENHPTIPMGHAGVTIINSMARQFESPCVEEGFEKLFVVNSFADADAILNQWQIPIPPLEDDGASKTLPGHSALLKFPRTAHLMNLGAATRDDKVQGLPDFMLLLRTQPNGTRIVVEEKIDGANMGISIDENGQIVVQNRSHFITPSYHPQFAPLHKWLADHTGDLWDILEPCRHILYGEWCYATHSVVYTALPSWFVAYDIFDRKINSFLGRHEVETILKRTSIPIVPKLLDYSLNNETESTCKTLADRIVSMVHGPSAYNDTQREGVVIRVCEGSATQHRCKLVRPDFICGNERWNKSHKLQTNSLKIVAEVA